MTTAGVIRPHDDLPTKYLWKTLPICDVAPLQRGFDLPITDIRAGNVPIVYSNGIERFHNKSMVHGPGVVTGRSGTIGSVHYVESDFWPHNTSLWVTNFKGNSPKFIYYLFSFIGFQRFSSGSGVPTLNRNDAHCFSISLPSSLEEQEAIADILSDADALIESLELLIAKKRAIKQGAMQELLYGQRRLPGFVEDWTAGKIGDVLSIQHGKSQSAVVANDGPYPILATGGQIGTANAFLWDKPSVLIGRKGTIDRPQYAEKPFWTVDTLFYSIMNGGNVAKFYYYLFCLIDWYSYNEASGVPSLNARTIENIDINIPHPDEQKAIVTILDELESDLANVEAQCSKARQIKQGMMQDLLTGRVRLV